MTTSRSNDEPTTVVPVRYNCWYFRQRQQMSVVLERMKGLRWTAGSSARLWYLQPHLQVAEGPPYQQVKSGARRSGLELAQAALHYDAEQYGPPGNAPTFVLLPEFGLHAEDVPAIKTMLVEARPNTILIAGIGQVNSEEAARIDPTADMWDGPHEGRLTNLAVIGQGGEARLFIQPKIIASRWEMGGTHWPGKAVRCFEGASIVFAVVICSDLVDQPDDATTVSRLIEDLREENRRLDLLIWLQHNPKPRSSSFHSSIEALTHAQPVPAVLVVSSRASDPSRRYENYAVSGALVHHDVLPPAFDMLDQRFRYVEPIAPPLTMARLVLLRYDVDAFLVRTAQPTAIRREDGTAKGRVCDECIPYVLEGDQLRVSDGHDHLRDLTEPAAALAKQNYPELAEEIGAVQLSLISLGTPGVLGFLDLAFAPRPTAEAVRHAPLRSHPGGAFRCDCWAHRQCLDYLSCQAESIDKLAEVLAAAGALRRCDPLAAPRFARHRPANFVMHIDGQEHPLAIAHPLGLDAERAERALTGGQPPLNDVPYVVLGTKEWLTRRRLASTDAAIPNPSGALQAGQMVPPHLRAVHHADFWQAHEKGLLLDTMRELVSRGGA